MYCRKCGKELSSDVSFCPSCGTAVQGGQMRPGYQPEKALSPFSRLATLLLCFFVGWLGIHRFYVGKVGTGVAMIFTLGGLGIWTLVDFIMIVAGGFTDADGRYVLDWQT